MRAVAQRVSWARVRVEGETVGEIGPGLLVLVGAAAGDTSADADALADKLAGLRIFPDDLGRMNRSVDEAGGAVLVVSQFTLLGDLRRGRRPSFTGAAPPEEAEPLVDAVVEHLRRAGVPCATGRFRAHMEVELLNDGPVTLVLEVSEGRVR
ncbi:MAG TPA: D-aminoacyl-tRNA deacylase [Acidimicrobiia bacterium]|nr:D-aminoacyl-tRNA deacylase [Acidimicrobiia bacterium]